VKKRPIFTYEARDGLLVPEFHCQKKNLHEELMSRQSDAKKERKQCTGVQTSIKTMHSYFYRYKECKKKGSK